METEKKEFFRRSKIGNFNFNATTDIRAGPDIQLLSNAAEQDIYIFFIICLSLYSWIKLMH